ncbi:hypothetical protein AAMO2058_001298900 [Amorphochlora amoebiformis]
MESIKNYLGLLALLTAINSVDGQVSISSCSTSWDSLFLRSSGSYSVVCSVTPSSCSNTVWGCPLYSGYINADSSICTAARMVGISAGTIFRVTYVGLVAVVGCTSNGYTSFSWSSNFASFYISHVGYPALPTPYPTPFPASSTWYPTPFPTPFPSPFPIYTFYPTPYPSPYPTPFPTPFPSPFPIYTFYPTPYPSPYPTSFPTYPTYYPTPYPSPYPTPFPTYPTPYPSPYPTPFPTYPTYYPSPYPASFTYFPTPYPTPSPTTYPTFYPTYYPTVNFSTPFPASSTRFPTTHPTPFPTSIPETVITQCEFTYQNFSTTSGQQLASCTVGNCNKTVVGCPKNEGRISEYSSICTAARAAGIQANAKFNVFYEGMSSSLLGCYSNGVRTYSTTRTIRTVRLSPVEDSEQSNSNSLINTTNILLAGGVVGGLIATAVVVCLCRRRKAGRNNNRRQENPQNSGPRDIKISSVEMKAAPLPQAAPIRGEVSPIISPHVTHYRTRQPTTATVMGGLLSPHPVSGYHTRNLTAATVSGGISSANPASGYHTRNLTAATVSGGLSSSNAASGYHTRHLTESTVMGQSLSPNAASGSQHGNLRLSSSYIPEYSISLSFLLWILFFRMLVTSRFSRSLHRSFNLFLSLLLFCFPSVSHSSNLAHFSSLLLFMLYLRFHFLVLLSYARIVFSLLAGQAPFSPVYRPAPVPAPQLYQLPPSPPASAPPPEYVQPSVAAYPEIDVKALEPYIDMGEDPT